MTVEDLEVTLMDYKADSRVKENYYKLNQFLFTFVIGLFELGILHILYHLYLI